MDLVNSGDNMNTSNQIIGNRGGIPFVTATQTDAGSATTNAIYVLPNHVFRFLGPVGIMILHINDAVTTATGITIQVNDQSLQLTSNTGTALTSLSAQDYPIIFNKFTNTLKTL